MDDEFTTALMEEFGEAPPETPTVEEPAEAVAEEQVAPEEQQEEEKAEEETPAEVPESEETPEGEPAEPQVEEEPKLVTKADVVDAMREYNQEQSKYVDKLSEVREEVISKIHPEGITKDIYDTNGEVIKTAQDIVDRNLLNPRTSEPFTYEEAASWLMDAQKTMNQNIEELNKYAGDIAEINLSLSESNQRVMDKWSDVLQSMPKVAEQLAEAYVKTLEFDKTGSYVTKAPIDPVEFYDLALAPYRQLNETLAEKQALEEAQKKFEEEQKQREAEVERDERIDVPRRGESRVKANTGDSFLDALLDEMT